MAVAADAAFAADPTSSADPRITTDGTFAAESNLCSLSSPCSRLVPCSGASLCEAFVLQSFAVGVLLRKCFCSGSRQCEVRLELLSLHVACISDLNIRLLWLLHRGRRSETGQLDQRPLQRVHLLQRVDPLQQVRPLQRVKRCQILLRRSLAAGPDPCSESLQRMPSLQRTILV